MILVPAISCILSNLGFSGLHNFEIIVSILLFLLAVKCCLEKFTFFSSIVNNFIIILCASLKLSNSNFSSSVSSIPSLNFSPIFLILIILTLFYINLFYKNKRGKTSLLTLKFHLWDVGSETPSLKKSITKNLMSVNL